MVNFIYASTSSIIGVGRVNMKSKQKNLVEKIINFLLNILIFIFGIILLISIYTGIQTKILGNDHTDFFGYSVFEVQTGSMSDTINAGDWIIVKLTQKVKLNDVITYKMNDEYITHRIIEVYKGTYITKGDANNAKDEPIDQKQIVGKVVKVLANFGIIRKTLFNPPVLITLIVTLFLFNLTFKKNKEDAKNKKTKLNQKGNNYLIVEAIVKKTRLFLKTVGQKVTSLIEKMKKDKKINKVNTVNTPKIEKQKVESYDKPSSVTKEKDQFIDKSDEPYKDEDELEKTSFYRVIPVDATEVDPKFQSAPTKAEVDDYYKDEDELDKTSLFRMISVDATEVDDTLLEIAENEIKGTDQNDKEKESEPKQEEQNKSEVPDEEDVDGIDLDFLKNKNGARKGKTIIDTVLLIIKEQFDEIINILVKDNKSYVNKPTIKDTFMNAYIDAKYYNYYEDKSNDSKNLKIEKVIKKVANQAINNYHGTDTKHKDVVNSYANMFTLIANLEQAYDSITDLKAKNEFYKKEIKKYASDWDNNKIKYVISEITELQKKYKDTVKYYLEKLETNMFNLNFNKLSTKKEDMYGLELQHNITFNKAYSDYIIDKTYTEGIIAEDKMSVLLTLLSSQLIKDMMASDFDKKYILYVPKSLYTKEKKFENLLDMIDDKYAKENVIILITLEDLSNNAKVVKSIRRLGYKFALIFDEETNIKETDRGNIYIVDYIFINKNVVNMLEILPFIPEELSDKVIYEDIADKVGDFGGE